MAFCRAVLHFFFLNIKPTRNKLKNHRIIVRFFFSKIGLLYSYRRLLYNYFYYYCRELLKKWFVFSVLISIVVNLLFWVYRTRRTVKRHNSITIKDRNRQRANRVNIILSIGLFVDCWSCSLNYNDNERYEWSRLSNGRRFRHESQLTDNWKLNQLLTVTFTYRL